MCDLKVLHTSFNFRVSSTAGSKKSGIEQLHVKMHHFLCWDGSFFCLSFLKMSNWCLSSTTPPIFRLIARALFWKICRPSIRPSTCSWGLQVFWKRQRFHTEIIRASKSFVVLGGVAALPSTHSVPQVGKKAHLYSVEIAEIYSPL